MAVSHLGGACHSNPTQMEMDTKKRHAAVGISQGYWQVQCTYYSSLNESSSESEPHVLIPSPSSSSTTINLVTANALLYLLRACQLVSISGKKNLHDTIREMLLHIMVLAFHLHLQLVEAHHDFLVLSCIL